MEHSEYIRAVNTYGNTVYRTAYSYCKNVSDSEDIVQNVYIKLFQTKTKFTDEEHMRKWLIRVATNEAKNLCTSIWKRKMVPLEDSYETLLLWSDRDECSKLYDAVMSLPDKYRIVTYLYYYEDYAVKEIAEILKRRETTVQTQLMRAREKLKMKLKEDWKDE